MTTRIFTPRPAQPAAKTTATGAMDGWRIEVRDTLSRCGDSYRTDQRPNGAPVTMDACWYVLTPCTTRPSDLSANTVHACADPLFETIYVSRELTGDEPDTLRRLMAEECGRERAARDAKVRAKADQLACRLGIPESPVVLACAEGIVDMQEREREPIGVCTESLQPVGKGPVYTLSYSAPAVTMHEAERQQRKAKMLDALDQLAANPNAVTFAVYDGMRHWSCPKCKMMLADVALDSRAFKCACGFSSEPYDEWQRHEAPLVQQAPTKGSSGWVKLADLAPKDKCAKPDLSPWVTLRCSDGSAVFACVCGHTNELPSSCAGQGANFACTCGRRYRVSWSSKKVSVFGVA